MKIVVKSNGDTSVLAIHVTMLRTDHIETAVKYTVAIAPKIGRTTETFFLPVTISTYPMPIDVKHPNYQIVLQS